MGGPQQLEFSQRSLVDVLVKERQVQQGQNCPKKKIFFDCRSSRKFFNMNNCHAKDFQHKNFPIYGTPHIGWYILYIPPLIGEFLGVYSEGHRPEWYRCFNNWREVISSNFWQHYSLSLACLAAPTGGKVMHVYCVLQASHRCQRLQSRPLVWSCDNDIYIISIRIF